MKMFKFRFSQYTFSRTVPIVEVVATTTCDQNLVVTKSED